MAHYYSTAFLPFWLFCLRQLCHFCSCVYHHIWHFVKVLRWGGSQGKLCSMWPTKQNGIWLFLQCIGWKPCGTSGRSTEMAHVFTQSNTPILDLLSAVVPDDDDFKKYLPVHPIIHSTDTNIYIFVLRATEWLIILRNTEIERLINTNIYKQ